MQFDVNSVYNIVFIGCGGTGGWLIHNVVRMLSVDPYFRNKQIILIDPDIVEQKNLLRQNFYNIDVGKYKAEQLALRYSAIYNRNIIYHNTALTIDNFYSLLPSGSLIIDSVDNKKARRVIHDELSYGYNSWLSLGNSDTEGQMVFRGRRSNSNSGEKDIVELFPNDFSAEAIKEEESVRISCADNALAQPQTLAINLQAAEIATAFLYRLFYDGKYDYNFVFFDTLNNITKANTIDGIYAKKPIVSSTNEVDTVESLISSMLSTSV